MMRPLLFFIRYNSRMALPKLANIENFRDLGVYEGSYGPLAPGVIYRSGSVYYGSEEDLLALKELGIKTVIDLRGGRLIDLMPHPFAEDPLIDVIPVEVPHGESFASIEEGVPLWYLGFIKHPYEARKFFQAVIGCPKPLLIHCEAGKDRTGVFSALLLLANGVSKEDVVKDYLLSYDGRLARTEKRTQEAYPDLEDFVFHPSPDTFATFIDMFFELYDSMENYFEAIGLNEDEISALSNLFGVQEVSAGAVVFYKNKVLVEHMALGHYSMPKGHVEPTDASLKDTALREIKEETGLDVEIPRDYFTCTVYSPKPGHIKRVYWFVAEAKGSKTKCQPEEVEDCYFLSPSDATRVLSHDSDRKVLYQVCLAHGQ